MKLGRSTKIVAEWQGKMMNCLRPIGAAVVVFLLPVATAVVYESSTDKPQEITISNRLPDSVVVGVVGLYDVTAANEALKGAEIKFTIGDSRMLHPIFVEPKRVAEARQILIDLEKAGHVSVGALAP